MTAVVQIEEATIKQQCKLLRMPIVASQCVPVAEQAAREKRTHLSFLEALLAAELEERERKTIERRIHDAHLPRLKTLEEFDFSQSPKVSAIQIQELAQGGYLSRAEPIIFIGDSGTGKTHCSQGYASQRAGRNAESGSLRLPLWLTNWLKPNISYNFGVFWHGGQGTI
jgi:DNA replication protein DnaC